MSGKAAVAKLEEARKQLEAKLEKAEKQVKDLQTSLSGEKKAVNKLKSELKRLAAERMSQAEQNNEYRVFLEEQTKQRIEEAVAEKEAAILADVEEKEKVRAIQREEQAKRNERLLISQQKQEERALISKVNDELNAEFQKEMKKKEEMYRQQIANLEDSLSNKTRVVEKLEDWKERQIEKENMLRLTKKAMEQQIAKGQEGFADLRKVKLVLKFQLVQRYVQEWKRKKYLRKMFTSMENLVKKLVTVDGGTNENSLQSEADAWCEEAKRIRKLYFEKGAYKKLKQAGGDARQYCETDLLLQHIADAEKVISRAIDQRVAFAIHWKDTASSFFRRNGELTDRCIDIENQLLDSTNRFLATKKQADETAAELKQLKFQVQFGAGASMSAMDAPQEPKNNAFKPSVRVVSPAVKRSSKESSFKHKARLGFSPVKDHIDSTYFSKEKTNPRYQKVFSYTARPSSKCFRWNIDPQSHRHNLAKLSFGTDFSAFAKNFHVQLSPDALSAKPLKLSSLITGGETRPVTAL